MINVRKAGRALVKSSKLIFTTDKAISTPKIIKAGAVAVVGKIPASGARTRAIKNNKPVVTSNDWK
jgi:hypothetical protein